jgi:hypothetical protein
MPWDDGPFSFLAVCDELEIDPEAVRQGLIRWAAEKSPVGNLQRFGARRCLPSVFQVPISLDRPTPTASIHDARDRAAWGDRKRGGR